MVAAVVLLRDDDGRSTSLSDQLVDVEWTVVTVDGAPVNAARPPTFTLLKDGRVEGFDGCNQYGFDVALPGGWTLTDGILGLDQQMVSTAMACPDIPVQVVPVADGTQLSLDGPGQLTMTSASGSVFTATS